MNSEINLLQTAISAMQKQEYPRAIEALEAFCRHNTTSKPNEYFEAQRWLIKAYQRNGQVNLAVYLCQQMTDSPNAQTRSWARSNLQWLQEESATKSESVSPEIASDTDSPAISVIENPPPIIEVQDLTQILGNTDPANLLSPAEVDKLLKDGQKALKMGRFCESIEKLEAVCAGVESSHKDLNQAQMSLVKAYQGSEQVARSIALCHYLKTSDKEYVQIWATEFLPKLTPTVENEFIPPIASNPFNSANGVESDEDEDEDTKSDEAEMSATSRQPQGDPKSLNPDATAKLELASQITLSLVIGGVVAMIVVIVASVMMKPQPTPTSPVGTFTVNLL